MAQFSAELHLVQPLPSCKMAPACPDEDNSVLGSHFINANDVRKCKAEWNQVLSFRGCDSDSKCRIKQAAFQRPCGCVLHLPQQSIPTLPCLLIISFLPGSCTRNWTGEYGRVHSTALQAALGHTLECLEPARKQCQTKDYDSNSGRV